jgi:hypothetical protein
LSTLAVDLCWFDRAPLSGASLHPLLGPQAVQCSRGGTAHRPLIMEASTLSW